MLRAGARMESLSLSETVDRARTVLREECRAPEMAAALARPESDSRRRGFNGGRRERGLRFLCGRLGHIARDCGARGGGGASGVSGAINSDTLQLGVRETRSERRIVRRPPLGTKMERRATGKSVDRSGSTESSVCSVLIDTGCTRSVVHTSLCAG